MPPNALLSEPMTAEGLRVLAMCALDAAKRAGARYADVRVAERHECHLSTFGGPLANLSLIPEFMYGIRVVVDDTMAFVYGSVPAPDAVATAARKAVATARGDAQLNGLRLELAPVPIATGEWETPTQMDPFSVPIMDQLALMLALMSTAHARTAFVAPVNFRWIRETRVVASTEGTMVTQTLRGAEPALRVGANKLVYASAAEVILPIIGPTAGGYECVTVPELPETMKQAADEAATLAAFPRGTLDVGRYSIVLDGTTLGAMTSQTLGVALELDRVLGDEMGAAGSSYLAPPQAVTGTMIASPQLTMTADRALPSITAVRWDDEGVEAQLLPLVTAGRFVNYCTSRDTAPLLRAEAASSASLTGCVIAPKAHHEAHIRVPHVTVAPGRDQARLEDLCADISHGVLIRNANDIAVDHQLASGFMSFEHRAGSAFEIVRGRIVRRLERNAVQFATSRLWKSLVALGDASTVQPSAVELYKGQPEVPAWQTASAPAGIFKDVDVIGLRGHA